jgi:hypothetical protein
MNPDPENILPEADMVVILFILLQPKQIRQRKQ